jgi:hypothetical protein
MTAKYGIMLLYVLAVLCLIVFAAYKGRKNFQQAAVNEAKQKQRAKRPKKSRSQRRMEREIFRRAIDAGASEAEARKAVRAYAARKAARFAIL